MWNVYVRIEAPSDLLAELASEGIIIGKGFHGIKDTGLVPIVVQHLAVAAEALRMVGDVFATEAKSAHWPASSQKSTARPT